MPQMPTNVDAIHPVSSRRRQYTRQKPRIEQSDLPTITNCRNCGNNHLAKKEKCLAFGQLCHNCKKINHFKKFCRLRCQFGPKKANYKKRHEHELEVDKTSVYDDTFYVDGIAFDRSVDTVNSFMAEQEEGFVTLHINKTPIEVKVDTGAMCNVISQKYSSELPPMYNQWSKKAHLT